MRIDWSERFRPLFVILPGLFFFVLIWSRFAIIGSDPYQTAVDDAARNSKVSVLVGNVKHIGLCLFSNTFHEETTFPDGIIGRSEFTLCAEGTQANAKIDVVVEIGKNENSYNGSWRVVEIGVRRCRLWCISVN